MRRPNPAFYPTQSFDRASNDHIALAMIIGLRETARDLSNCCRIGSELVDFRQILRTDFCLQGCYSIIDVLRGNVSFAMIV